MIFKIFGILLILFFIYSIFFKKQKDNKKDKLISEDMVECKNCKIYVSINEVILENDNNYCSEECLRAKK